MEKRPSTVTAAFAFLLVIAIVWFTFGGIIAADAHPALPPDPVYKIILASLSIGFGGVLLILTLMLTRHVRWAYYLLLASLTLTMLLTLFDDVGLVDLAVVVFSLVPMILLIMDRSWYLQPISPSKTSG